MTKVTIIYCSGMFIITEETACSFNTPLQRGEKHLWPSYNTLNTKKRIGAQNSMNICFITSSYYLTPGNLAHGGKAWIHGLALPLLASYVGDGHSVSLINDSVHPIPNKDHFDIFFISIMGSVIDRARDLANTLKTDKNYIIAGGKTLNEFAAEVEPFVDGIILGEGEGVIGQIVSDVKNKRLQKRYGSPDLRNSLENLLVPRYDLIDRKRHGFMYPVEATRGCTNSCSFCYVHAWSKGLFRKRPIEHVIRDIEHLKTLDIRHVLFVDDNLFLDREYALALFRRMEPLKIKWVSQVTAAAVADEELMKAASVSGCIGLTIGYESMTLESLKNVNKPNNPDTY